MVDENESTRLLPKVPKRLFVTEEKIGTGAFGEVYLARRLKNWFMKGSKMFAVKVCTLGVTDVKEKGQEDSEETIKDDIKVRGVTCSYAEGSSPSSLSQVFTKEDCIRELQILQHVQTGTAKYVTKYFMSFEFDAKAWIVMEVLPTSLRRMLTISRENGKRKLNMKVCAYLVQQTLLALKHLKQKEGDSQGHQACQYTPDRRWFREAM